MEDGKVISIHLTAQTDDAGKAAHAIDVLSRIVLGLALADVGIVMSVHQLDIEEFEEELEGLYEEGEDEA